jgi:signal transduction histidine kinase
VLPIEAAVCVYRVAQEALQNSIKHSRVDEAEVVLSRTGDQIRLVVSDRGAGMDAGTAGGLGLVSMKERIRLVNGEIAIESHPGKASR